MKPKQLLVLLSFLIKLCCISATPIDEYPLVCLTQSDGLAGESVNRLITDHSGLTWIATNSGVNTYNGKDMHTLPITGEHGRPLEVSDLCETKSCIYAATDEGLWYITMETGIFKRILPEIEHPLCLFFKDERLYIGSRQGIHIYDGMHLKHIDVSVGHKGLDNIVRQYVADEEGNLWLLGRKWLGCYNPLTEKLTYHPFPVEMKNCVPTQFASLGHHRFVMGTSGNGLLVLDMQQHSAERVEGISNVVPSVYRSSDGLICVSTNGAGAYLLEQRDGQLVVREHFCTEGAAGHKLPANALYSYYRDINGVNWFGFVRYGLAYTYYRGSQFHPFSVGGFTTEGLNVRTYCQHGHHVIIGTQDGFYYVNTLTSGVRFFSSADLGNAHIVNSVAWYDNRFYIGTFDGGLCVFDPETKHLYKQTVTTLLDNVSIGDLKVGPDGRLWVGSNNGVVIIDKDKVSQHFTEQNSRIVGGFILSITFDQSGNAWLTGATGCSLYSAKSREIVETNFPDGFFNRQPWMIGTVGHDGKVFMRTGPQTFYTNESMTDFGELKLPVKFTDKWCRHFVDDGKGYYLVASERGLYYFNYALTSVAHFGYGEGLLGDYVNYMSHDSLGNLWVATSQGLYMTEVDKWKAWSQSNRNKVQLTKIRCGSDLLSEVEVYRVNSKRQLRLSWNFTSEVLQAVY